MENTVKVGDVVGVKGTRGTVSVFVFRTFTNGEFRAIPETHPMYRNAIEWLRLGDTAALKAHQVEIEYMSRVYSLSELRDGGISISSRFTDPTYLKAERSVSRSKRSIRRNVK